MSARSTGLFLLAEIQDDLAVGWLGLRYTNLERTYEDVVFISSNYGMVAILSTFSKYATESIYCNGTE